MADKIALKTLGQSRARHAWESVKAVKTDHAKCAEEYRSLARSAGAMILTNGLGQFLAFMRSKAKGESNDKPKVSEHGLLFEHISSWVCAQLIGRETAGRSDLLKEIVQRDSLFLRRATAESLAYIEWLRRFAEAEVPKKEGGE